MSRMNSFNLNNLNAGVQMQKPVQSQAISNQVLTQINKTRLLSQYIGRKCTCEFYLDSDIIKKTGLLESVGTDFIVLTSTNNPEERLVCPLDELKFIKIC